MWLLILGDSKELFMKGIFGGLFSFCSKCGVACGFILTMTNPIEAKELPVWEAGVGGAGLTMSHYLGADETGRYAFAYPFFIYRSEYIQADREGLRGKLCQRENWKLNVSLNASLLVYRVDNRAREAIDDLDPLLGRVPKSQFWF